ncbi:MAG: response regulator transcription factor [Egibacteraceae bacterium]
MPVRHCAPAHASQPGQTRHLTVGAATAAVGERAQALTEVAHAHARAEATMTRTLREQAAREQRRKTARRATSGRQGLSALSTRELEIAELVSDGHTNRQIARRLARSEKTIETHLSHIFTKLGVSSRAAVASAIARAGRAPSSVGDDVLS